MTDTAQVELEDLGFIADAAGHIQRIHADYAGGSRVLDAELVAALAQMREQLAAIDLDESVAAEAAERRLEACVLITQLIESPAAASSASPVRSGPSPSSVASPSSVSSRSSASPRASGRRASGRRSSGSGVDRRWNVALVGLAVAVVASVGGLWLSGHSGAAASGLPPDSSAPTRSLLQSAVQAEQTYFAENGAFTADPTALTPIYPEATWVDAPTVSVGNFVVPQVSLDGDQVELVAAAADGHCLAVFDSRDGSGGYTAYFDGGPGSVAGRACPMPVAPTAAPSTGRAEAHPGTWMSRF